MSINVAAQAISSVEDSAIASSMYGFMRSLGMPRGVAISGAIFQNAMASKLSSFDLLESIAHDSEQYVYKLRGTTLDAVFTWVAASALIVSLMIKRFDLNKKLQSQFTARQPGVEAEPKTPSLSSQT
ncbi:hypothetical protein P280DRAFT_472719 [Massarina eburnea CBS 473.64]|uniref:Uncharacterized protein n=1 Tax=Massarina eburnea CBS 473.64 TaxID=1395130 RepID=A0A6A6RMD1_9PLEO|nr:hypothetical protein P280DRAFT_472719 [Massarina eburnea CBS 473.64]